MNTVSSNGDVWRDVRLNHLDMLWIARQIGSGMVYLSDRKFVHRYMINLVQELVIQNVVQMLVENLST